MSANFPPHKSPLPALEAFGNWLTAPSAKISDIGEQRRAKLAATLSLLLAVLNSIGGLFSYFGQAENILQVFIAPIAVILIAYSITRTRYFSLGSFILVTSFSATGFLNIIFANKDISTYLFIFVPISLIIASALLSPWALFLLTGVNIAAVVFLLPASGIALPHNINLQLGQFTTQGALLILLNIFRQNIEKQRIKEIQKTNQELMEVRDNLEKRVEERTMELNRRSTQLEASTIVARSAAMVRDLNELLDSTVNQISERFGFYHAGIFLADSAEKFIVLQAASSEGGRQLLKRGLKMEIGRQGVVGYAAYHKRPRIVQDVSTDSAYVRIPELSNTRSEVALPLIVRNRIIGVLDIQSEESNAFKFDDVYTLQTMADQVALAIDNTLLLEESRVALQQLENLNATNAANIWKAHMREGARGFTYTPLGIAPVADVTENEQTGNEKAITVPLNLRGKVIGTISLKRKTSDPAWAEAEREMAERVASQVALAVENARLLEESQHRAMREQKVNELSNRFSRSLDVDALLQNAIRELHNLPQVAEVAVFINPEKETSKAK
jgi:GAF domain-containing protein